MDILKVVNLTKEYKNGNVIVIANRNISFDVNQGEAIGIIGENGAGKTTLLKQIVGITKKTSGYILFDGELISKNGVGYMGQQRTDAFNHLSIEEALRYATVFKGLSMNETTTKVDELLKFFGLLDIRKKLLKTASVGCKQIIDFCIAVSGKCDLIVLDEPLSNLDTINKQKVVNHLNILIAKKVSVIMVSHNLLEIENIVKRVILIKNGEIIEDSSLTKVKQKYDKYVYFYISNDVSDFFKDKIHSFAKNNNYTIHSNTNRYTLVVPFSQVSILLDFILHEKVYNYVDDFRLQCGELENVFINIYQKGTNE